MYAESADLFTTTDPDVRLSKEQPLQDPTFPLFLPLVIQNMQQKTALKVKTLFTHPRAKMTYTPRSSRPSAPWKPRVQF